MVRPVGFEPTLELSLAGLKARCLRPLDYRRIVAGHYGIEPHLCALEAHSPHEQQPLTGAHRLGSNGLSSAYKAVAFPNMLDGQSQTAVGTLATLALGPRPHTWSEWWESNPRHDVGNVTFYH